MPLMLPQRIVVKCMQNREVEMRPLRIWAYTPRQDIFFYNGLFAPWCSNWVPGRNLFLPMLLAHRKPSLELLPGYNAL